jgi:AcrR family transcriptional regulator
MIVYLAYAGRMESTTTQPRRRNAALTRQLLLEVASTLFARDGYASTTVRDIADAAGVNVALINRYFTSKEGLFEACLTSAVSEIRRNTDEMSEVDIAASIASRIAGSPTPRMHEAMLLLLRSSGDERVDGMRRTVVLSMSERLAAAGGRAEPPDERRVLRAQIIIAASLGMTLLRASLGVAPLAAATEEELAEPLTDLVGALLPGRQQPLSNAPDLSQRDGTD